MIRATFWNQATPGTTYWRCTVPARSLPGQVLDLDYSDACLDENEEPFMPRQKGAAIWQFPGNVTRMTLIDLCRDLGHKTLAEVDDNYLLPPPSMPFVRSPWKTDIKESYTQDHHSHQMHRKIVRDHVDAIICTGEWIANCYEKVTGADIYICPNSADLKDWPERPARDPDRPVTVGYAGSDSHFYDLHIIDRAMDAAYHGGAKLVKLGAGIKEWRWPHTQIPWADNLSQYRLNLVNAQIDVGLCPLKNTDWHNSKSDVKAIEYTLAGALPIVQRDVWPYREWHDVVPSASTEKEWMKVVKWAINSPDEVHAAWLEALDYVMNNKLIEHHIHKWEEAIS